MFEFAILGLLALTFGAALATGDPEKLPWNEEQQRFHEHLAQLQSLRDLALAKYEQTGNLSALLDAAAIMEDQSQWSGDVYPYALATAKQLRKIAAPYMKD